MELKKNLYAFIWRDARANNCNTYFVNGKVPLLIDPGHRAFFPRVRAELAQQGHDIGKTGLVIPTHGHPDHMEALDAFADLPALKAIHEQEAAFLKTMRERLHALMGSDPLDTAFDFFLREGSLQVGDLSLEILHTPGHSPGSVCLYWPEARALFSGDLLFASGVGRTDIPGGNGAQLKESICRLEALSVEYLLPGHGDPVQGSEAVKKNFQLVKALYFDYV